VFVIVC